MLLIPESYMINLSPWIASVASPGSPVVDAADAHAGVAVEGAVHRGVGQQGAVDLGDSAWALRHMWVPDRLI